MNRTAMARAEINEMLAKRDELVASYKINRKLSSALHCQLNTANNRIVTVIYNETIPTACVLDVMYADGYEESVSIYEKVAALEIVRLTSCSTDEQEMILESVMNLVDEYLI